MGVACGTHGRDQRYVVYTFLLGKPERKRPLGRAWRRWEDNGELGREGVDWIDLAQDRNQWRTLVNMVMKVRVLQMSENFVTS